MAEALQVAQAGPPVRRRSYMQRDRILGIALVTPSILATAVFVYGFIGWSIRVSLSQWRGLIPDFTFVGLQQYIELMHDRRFHDRRPQHSRLHGLLPDRLSGDRLVPGRAA